MIVDRTVASREGRFGQRWPQRFENGEIHDWYRFVWGYSDHLVAGLLDEFSLSEGDRVLDPFCGTGTTLVECLKRGIDCVGVDASPASLFISRVKTDWCLKYERLLEALEGVVETVADLPNQINAYQDDLTYAYLVGSGMLARKWINPEPLRAALAIKHAIITLKVHQRYKNALTLALLNTVVQDASNVRFGPELYVGRAKRDVDLVDAFGSRVMAMAFDLTVVRNTRGTARVCAGDARHLRPALGGRGMPRFQAVICSPPYPAEHDYTRNTRLELAFLEATTGIADLQAIKRTMIRSNTKGIYADDTDWKLVWAHPQIASIARRIEQAVSERTHGFARLYSTVIASYFGGMYRHLRSVSSHVAPEGKLAYVVSEQAAYGDTPVPTAHILAELAEWTGLKVLDIRHWRNRKSSLTARVIAEEILILQRPRSKATVSRRTRTKGALNGREIEKPRVTVTTHI